MIPSRDIHEGPEALWNAVRFVLSSQRDVSPVVSVPRDGPIPASFAQQRIWLHQRLAPGTPLYNLTVGLRLVGTLSIECLSLSLSDMVRRHEILRTTFHLVGEQLLQKIHTPPDFEMPVIDLNDVEISSREEEAQRLADVEARQPIDLARPPLIRAKLLRLGDREHILVLTVHHLAFDGSSFDPFMRELRANYEARIQGSSSPLPAPELQYADYAAWQRLRARDDAFEPLRAYWKQQLTELPSNEGLRPDHSRAGGRTYRGAVQSLPLSRDLTDELRRVSAAEGVTLFVTLLAALQTLMHRYTGAEDLVVGSPIANRNRIETQEMIGPFFNTLALRTRVEGQFTLRDLLGRVREVVLGAIRHQDLPFELLDESPALRIMLAYQNLPRSAWTLPGLTLDAWNIANGATKFDITIIFLEERDGLLGLFEYDAELFEPETISQFMSHYRMALETIVRDRETTVATIPLLTPAETHWLLTTLNSTAVDYPRDETIVQLFESQAAASPDAVALVCDEHAMSYGELERRSNRLARHLVNCGVSPAMLIGVCLESSKELIVTLLAILKAGAAFVPIDPAWPSPYAAGFLSAAALRLVVTKECCCDALSGLSARIVCLDTDSKRIDAESDRRLDIKIGPESLAYVMYTSGSTGKPKGVCINHRGVVRLVRGANYVSLASHDVFLQVSPVTFDTSTFEIWGALLNGSTLALLSGGRPSLQEMSQAIRKYQVSVLFLTPGLFELFVDTHLEDLTRVRQLLVGGDVLSVSYAERFLSRVQDCQLINCYGPTESTTFASFHPVQLKDCMQGERIPIGKPISNTEMYVLDAHRQPVPIGVRGELFLGGDGLMQGYLDDPQTTRDRLVPVVFEGSAPTVLYRTGDFARIRRDGNCEFLGRIDNQVKIRGFRIEPGEIEALLGQCSEVKKAAVVAREQPTGGRKLIAYVVPSREEISPGDAIRSIRGFLRQRAPANLMPHDFVLIDNLPLNSNGKVDREALASSRPAFNRDQPNVYGSAIERSVAQAFELVLGLPSIGRDEDFFELGGDSLAALQLLTLLETIDSGIPFAALFERPTVAGLSDFIRAGGNSEVERVRNQPGSSSVLVQIKPGRLEMPLFFVPGGHGRLEEVTLYAKVMRHLDRDQAVYGLLAPDVEASVATRAATNIAEIRRLQPSGPYAIAGACVGGVVAFEMAQQLAGQGDRVALLLLMDTWRPMDRKQNDWLGAAFTGLRNKVALVCSGFRGLRRVLREAFRARPPFERDGWRRYWLNTATTLKRKAETWTMTFNQIEETMRYSPRPYAGDITLFISSESAEGGLANGWRDLCGGEFSVHTVPGKHVSHIRETPQITGERLNQVIGLRLSQP